MTISTTTAIDIFKKILKIIIVTAFWLGVWELASRAVDNSYFLPSVKETLKALSVLMKSEGFYKTILSSLLRVLSGLLLGSVGGVVLAVLCHHISFLRDLFTPLISVIKAMPVATFIIILWITLRGSALSIFIGFMMVMPIIFQNVLCGYDSIDKNLVEVTRVFEFSRFKTFRVLTLPTLFSYFAPAFITSIGLAFKSQIAAEIIAYTNNSIGQYIFDAKYNLLTDRVFAWAVVIVVFSILLENITRLLLGRLQK